MPIFNTRNPIEYPLGLVEALASMASGAVGQIAGVPAGLLKAITSGQYGTQEGVQTAQEEANRIQQAMTYQPRTETAVQGMGLLGKALEASKIPPVMPELQGLAALSAYPGKTAAVVDDFTNYNRQLTVPGVSNVVKQKGGNWLGNTVDNFVNKNLKTKLMTPEQIANQRANGGDFFMDRYEANNANPYAVNNWVDKKIVPYLKNDFAAETDPIRKAIDEGVNYIRGNEVNVAHPVYQSKIQARRAAAGFPESGVATTEAGQAWENLADFMVHPRTAQKFRDMAAGDMYDPSNRLAKQDIEANPWMSKVPGETPIYQLSSANAEDMGFKGLLDFLRGELESGAITKEQLNKTTIDQAVRKYGAYNDKLAQEAVKNTGGMPIYKDYGKFRWQQLALPETKLPSADKLPEGYKMSKSASGGVWIDAPDGQSFSGATPAEAIQRAFGSAQSKDAEQKLATALKYEGDRMGHCVGGYCPDVVSGEKKIYSLRDAKGEPHVTIEVMPQKIQTWDDVTKAVGADNAAKLWDEFDRIGGYNMDNTDAAFDMFIKQKNIQMPDAITQIKGKQNMMPKEEYLPYVQDFVNSRQWSDVLDFNNTGLAGDSYMNYMYNKSRNGLLGQ